MIRYTRTRYSDKFGYHDTDEVIGRSLSLYAEYSQIEVDFLLGLLDEKSIVYDVGANIGYHTSAFASRAGKVYAFEPNPHNYSLLMQNVESKGNVLLMNCAVSATNGTTKISDYNPDVPGNYGSMHVGGDDAKILVPMMSIDEMGLEKPDMIKIDVEGSEYEVFKGAMKTIAEHKPTIYYEAHETPHFKEIYELLEPLGYSFYWAQVNNYNPNNARGNILNVFGNTALFSVLAWPEGFAELPLDKVLGPDDSWEKLNSRAAQRNK